MIVTWAVWWHWPPQPELRLVLSVPEDTNSWEFSPDGRSVICVENLSSNRALERGTPLRMCIFELPAGILRTTIEDKEPYHGWDFSPDGSRLKVSFSDWTKQLREAPTGRLIHHFTKHDTDGSYLGFVHWSPDGRHWITDGDSLFVFRAENGERVGRLNNLKWLYWFRPNGTGLVALDENKGKIGIYSFDAAKPIVAIPLPGPLTNDPWAFDGPPKPGTIAVRDLAISADETVVFALLTRFKKEDGKDGSDHMIARWSRKQNSWTEVNVNLAGKDDRVPCKLVISPDGRFASRHTFVRVGNRWADTGPPDARTLWDFSVEPPRCCNDSGFPGVGEVSFDSLGKRIVNVGSNGYEVFDAASLVLISRETNSTFGNPLWSQDARYMALNEVAPSNISKQLPKWLPAWLQRFVEPQKHQRIVRVADGTTTIRIPGRITPSWTNDGKLWTAMPLVQEHVGGPLILERWSPERPTPWWLWALTSVAVMLVLRNHRWLLRRRVASVPS